jgi:hypothetical protein
MPSQFTRLLARLQAQPQPDPGIDSQANALFRRLKADVLHRTLV